MHKKFAIKKVNAEFRRLVTGRILTLLWELDRVNGDKGQQPFASEIIMSVQLSFL